MDLEVAVVDLPGIGVVVDELPERIELCTNLELGGLTPHPDLLAQSLEVATPHVQIHPLLRPRPGGFEYTQEEVEKIVLHARHAVREGASGVIFGALTPAGDIDEDTVRRVVAETRNVNPHAQMTFHRAFDVAASPGAALDLLVDLGIDRIMSSGGKAGSGVQPRGLARLVTQAAGRVEVMAGGGLTIEHVTALRDAGVDAFHFSARRHGQTNPDPDLVRAARWATRNS